MTGLIERSVAPLWASLHVKALAAAQQQLLDPLSGYPDIPTSAAVVFGSGALSAVIAARAAQAVQQGDVTRRIYFTGGDQVTRSPSARKLLPYMRRAGYPDPYPREPEAEYMLRVFQHILGQDNTHHQRKIECKIEAGSHNTWQSCRNTGIWGAKKEPSLTLVTQPLIALRVMATWRQAVDKTQPLRPMMAWPQRELGITPDNWQRRLLTLALAKKEARKILGHAPPYVEKLFCSRPDPRHDRQIFSTLAR